MATKVPNSASGAQPLAPPPSASETYHQLHHTATSFTRALAPSPSPSHPNNFDADLLLALLSPSFTHALGHNYFLSRAPQQLAGVRDAAGFVQHLERMIPKLESWEIGVTDVLVDEVKMAAVVRASYWMRVKGGAGEVEEVENDLVWWLGMGWVGEADGKDMKVEMAMEFVDGVASSRIGEVMRGGGER